MLDWAASSLNLRCRLPRVGPVVFLTAPGLHSKLDDVQCVRVYGRDDDSTGLPWIWRDLLAMPPSAEAGGVSAEFSRDLLPVLLRHIGIRAATAHLRFGEDWKLDSAPIDA